MNRLTNAILGAAAAAALVQPAFAQVTKTVDFSETFQPVTVAYGDTEVALLPFSDKSNSTVEVVALIKANGFDPISTREGLTTVNYHAVEVGIGKLSSSDPVPSVLLGGYTGGAHCCATLVVITPNAGKLKALEFAPVDGSPESEFPKDIDGDGTVDFVRQDDSFRYQFASGAGSYSPPKIYNIYKGQLVDVTDQTAYQPVWKAFASQVREDCADKTNPDRNGACIALAAAGARLGNFQAYLREAVANASNDDGATLPESCEVELTDYLCPKGKEIKFYTFESAANWFLRKQGYIK